MKNELSKAEKKVLDILLTGASQASTSEELGVSIPTVKKHMKSILKKYKCTSSLGVLAIELQEIEDKLRELKSQLRKVSRGYLE